MREKFEDLLVGYILILLVAMVVLIFVKMIPGSPIAALLFISGTLFYPAMLIGRNLKKIRNMIQQLKS